MAGGLMQLVAYGAQDVYLTGNPQITFFKVVYRRHTNFSIEAIELSLNGNPDFGRRSTVTITRNGDLICEVYLMITLPEVTPSTGSKFAWIRRVGHGIIGNVEVEIGGSRIDKQYGIWFNIWYELARPAGDQERGFAKMVGDVPELTKYDGMRKKEYLLYVPLQFWFNRHVGLALPLIALQYHEVRLHFEFRRAQELVIVNKTFKECDMNQVFMKDAILLVNYIYLDSEERRRFAQVGHEYLIEQLQFTGEESVTQQTHKYKLDFNHPTKELIWAMKNGNYNSGKTFLNYTHEENWNECGPCGILHETAVKILQESMQLICVDNWGMTYDATKWDVFPPVGYPDHVAVPRCTAQNHTLVVMNNSPKYYLLVNDGSLEILSSTCNEPYGITSKITAEVNVYPSGSTQNPGGDQYCTPCNTMEQYCDGTTTCMPEIVVSNVSSTLTVRDLSIPVELMCDTRCDRDDVTVYQCWNFGILIDGTGNPVEYALIQLNGHDRFDRREGPYFNYVIPWERHTNTPTDGINVYSFALNPEEHQPSGSANLSRIDNTQLNIWFKDSTWESGLPCLDFLNANNKLFIYAVNYNVLRIMSGMGGLAYSN